MLASFVNLHATFVIPAQADWPLFRNTPAGDGVAVGSLPDQPELLWKLKFKDAMFESTPAIVGEVIYIGGLDGPLRALKLTDGGELWQFKTELGFKAAAAVREGRVFIGDCDGAFVCLDAKTGEKIWGKSTDAEISAGANFYQDRVLFGSQDGSLFCCQASDGKELWKYAIENQIQCMPTVVENRVFLAGCDGNFHVIDIDTGKAVAVLPINDPTNATPAAVGDMVYFGTQGASFLAVNWKKPEITWTYEPRRKSPFQSSAAVKDGIVVIGGRDRQLHAIDAADGKLKWSFPSKTQIDASPVIVGDRVFVGTGDGRVVGLRLTTGDKLWEYETGGGFTGSPAVSGGRL
ncbi:MAG: PQQ-binding-like beta-propeller repeat protein, partial [Planctomycetaceae bacterium]|nr:PQQ-binding-like beta-propeller repeat protein [Planctomycetaceae bacterium]